MRLRDSERVNCPVFKEKRFVLASGRLSSFTVETTFQVKVYFRGGESCPVAASLQFIVADDVGVPRIVVGGPSSDFLLFQTQVFGACHNPSIPVIVTPKLRRGTRLPCCEGAIRARI